VLLFSANAIEVRDISTGRFVQAIFGDDVRLLHDPCGTPGDSILVAMKGTPDDQNGRVWEDIFELVERQES
jgi:RHO1 GDP-GTP exchange protein 1/2